MAKLGTFFARMRKDEEGATMVEYSILIGIITVLAITFIGVYWWLCTRRWADLALRRGLHPRLIPGK